MLGPQQLLHEAVHLLGQRLVQVVSGLVHGVVVRAPVVQLDDVQHVDQGANNAVGAVRFGTAFCVLAGPSSLLIPHCLGFSPYSP